MASTMCRIPSMVIMDEFMFPDIPKTLHCSISLYEKEAMGTKVLGMTQAGINDLVQQTQCYAQVDLIY